MQTLWQTFLVIVGLLGWHVDGLQGGATLESILANLLNTSGELYSFQSNTVNECFIIYQSNRPLNDYRLEIVASFTYSSRSAGLADL